MTIFLLDLANIELVCLHSEIISLVNIVPQNININYYLCLCLFLSKSLPRTGDFLDLAYICD